jgi:hypothetical protein
MRRFSRFLGCAALVATAACSDDPIRVDELDAGGKWTIEVTSTGGPPAGCVFVDSVGGLAELAASGKTIVVEQTDDRIDLLPIEYRRGNATHRWTLEGVVEGRKIEATLTHEVSLTFQGLVSTRAGVETLFGTVDGPHSFEAKGNGVHFGPDPTHPSLDQCSEAPVASYRMRVEPSPATDAD